MSDEKITALEITLAHHEQQIQDLNEMINKQWKEIDDLKFKLTRVTKQLREVSSTASEPGENQPMSVSEIAASEKPPHY